LQRLLSIPAALTDFYPGLTINAYLQRLRCGICRGHVAVAALQRQRRGREVEVIGLRGKGQGAVATY
jgi:hypothetical protein